MLEIIVRKKFKDTINKTFREKTEIKAFLLNHERFDLAVKKTVANIANAEQAVGSLTVKETAERIAEESCKFFCGVALDHKARELRTEAEKQAEIDKAMLYKRAEETMNELETEALSTAEHSFLNEATRGKNSSQNLS